ncbi:hypothetical protein SAZ10_30515 [Mesorhizobium sp. BAC0120]|uniref:hypothetical protein n=1 Tax=Mesorhizobium sp. BAC0120 TaxID=3090670 RepID=UPI00298C681A|nr:hypothetical protein [Mesorhizobium sp. BAC0120]MDW6026101.1 hypothetical protein [Mesorhizobium sp. BAC0120]
MSDERNARPVSGEIMTAGTVATEPARAGARALDVVDAEFETLRSDPAERLPAVPLKPAIATVVPPAQGLDTLRRSDAASAARGGPIFWTAGLAVAVGAFWVSGGHALLRQAPFMPGAPQIQPANPMRISGVTSRIEDHAGRMILFVDGKALNDGAQNRALPPIEISVTANDGHIVRYNLGTSQHPLGAGGEISFSSRFEAPKEGVKSISVAFKE